nr:MAG TPA: hypothetical protein [Ackermannviridae sp.]
MLPRASSANHFRTHLLQLGADQFNACASLSYSCLCYSLAVPC